MSDAVWDDRAPGPREPKPPKPNPPPTPAPAPIRLTDASDGDLLNRGYSYWPNAWIAPDGALYAFVGHADGRPRFYRVNLSTGAVERLGPLLGYGGTGEGWYWDINGRISLCDGPRLRRVNPFGSDDTVVLDISEKYPGCRLWQAHSSDDGLTHSATVERITAEGPYQRLGTAVQRPGDLRFYGAIGVLDESQITPDGEYLLIKENDDNRFVHLSSGIERTITNAEGALGHSDCGAGFVVGEDDRMGACVYLDLSTLSRRALFHTWHMGVVSVRGQWCIVSDVTHISSVALDGSGVTPLVQHGMQGSGYDFTVRANLDPSGRAVFWLSNQYGRMDAFVLALG